MPSLASSARWQIPVGRRSFLAGASAIALMAPAMPTLAAASQKLPQPLPLGQVTLLPSLFSRSVETNRRVLFALEPDRLLHKFRLYSGLEPKAEHYGGWESLGIAGHTLGHYLTALSILAARGDGEAHDRIAYIVDELAQCQAAEGDGYIGATFVTRDGQEVDGKIVYEEVRRREISDSGFDLNGGWVPLYVWHKVQMGLIDAWQVAGVATARPVLLKMADYLATILEGLPDEDMQRVLAAEHGGLNEAYAQLYAITGTPRWLALAERIRHKKVLDPLAAGTDQLAGLHANTQIPKLIGLARLHELTGQQGYGDTARFFYHTVIDHHSYAIGGNSEREHFMKPGVEAGSLTDRTCEACNSYNMLKLARHVWSWDRDPARFDEYERTWINHILAHQHPETGMYVYFMPLRSGSKRAYSTLEDSFWCCMGSGLESHAKHGDSAFWQDGGDALYVNLFVPAHVDWREGGMAFTLDTAFPHGEDVTIAVDSAPRGRRTLALRIPGWCAEPEVTVNGEPIATGPGPDYLRIKRRWREGDRVQARFPMTLAIEAAMDDPDTVSFRHGPLVLAADLGKGEHGEAPPLKPALVSTDIRSSVRRVPGDEIAYELADAVPEKVRLTPFYAHYDNRYAVYFQRFSMEQWRDEEAAYRAEQEALQALDARTMDVIYLGEMQPERDHAFRASHAELVYNGGRSGRSAWWGQNSMQFELAVDGGPVVLRAMYWGEETGKNFHIDVDGTRIATEERTLGARDAFVHIDYPLPESLTRGKSSITVRIEAARTDAPVYEVRTLHPDTVEAITG